MAASCGDSEVASCTTIDAVMYGMTPSAGRLIRLSDPPEKVLKKSRTPPLVFWLSSPNAVGSTPGSGTNDSRRKTINAPMVNHSRFLRSVACENLDRASPAPVWLAADAM